MTKEKDTVLCALDKWEGQKLMTLLQCLGDCGKYVTQVKEQINGDLTELSLLIQDSKQRQTAAEKLGKLQTLELNSGAFGEAKRRLQEYRNFLNQCSAEDYKKFALQLESNDFKGLKSLLGQAPEKADMETQWAKDFVQRLEKIQGAIQDRVSLAKHYVGEPSKFAEEFSRLKEAEKEVGEYLQLYKDHGFARNAASVGLELVGSGTEHLCFAGRGSRCLKRAFALHLCCKPLI